MEANETKSADVINGILRDAGITLTFQHVPTTYRAGAAREGDWGKGINHIAWRVTVKGRRGEFVTDYRAGIGHLPEGLKPGWGGVKYEQGLAIDATLKTGKVHKPRFECGYNAPIPTKTPLPTPDPADVVACLVSDAEAMDYASYEEWAREFGYDADGRKGEATYRACRETALNLLCVMGADVVERLKEPCREL